MLAQKKKKKLCIEKCLDKYQRGKEKRAVFFVVRNGGSEAAEKRAMKYSNDDPPDAAPLEREYGNNTHTHKKCLAHLFIYFFCSGGGGGDSVCRSPSKKRNKRRNVRTHFPIIVRYFYIFCSIVSFRIFFFSFHPIYLSKNG